MKCPECGKEIDGPKRPKVEISTGMGWMALALLYIFFLGDPDLVDALIHALMN